MKERTRSGKREREKDGGKGEKENETSVGKRERERESIQTDAIRSRATTNHSNSVGLIRTASTKLPSLSAIIWCFSYVYRVQKTCGVYAQTKEYTCTDKVAHLLPMEKDAGANLFSSSD